MAGKRRCVDCDKWFAPNFPQRRSCFKCRPFKPQEERIRRQARTNRSREKEASECIVRLADMQKDPDFGAGLEVHSAMMKQCL